MEEKELEVSLDKVYDLPEFKFIKYNNVILAIAVEYAKWIVIENENQLDIFNMLLNKVALREVLEKYDEVQEDISCILIQIEAKLLESRTKKSSFLNTRLHLHLTNKCNLNCPHCYMKSGKALEDELTTEEIKILCDKFHEYGGTNVSLTGGEPTIHPDFYEIAKYISDIGMKVSIFSNGFMWDEDEVKKLSGINIEGIQISIDGFDDDSNSIFRGHGSFEKALKTIDLLIKYNIYVKVAVTAPYEIIKEHVNNYIEFSKSLLNKYGRDKIEINYSYFFMPGRNLSRETVNKCKEKYYKYVDSVVTSIYENIDEDSFVDNIFDCIYDSCGYGGLNILANGDIYFCDRIPDVGKIGNIKTMDFKEIVRLMKIAEKAGKIDNFQPCSSCELKYICGGGCRAEYFKDFTKINDMDNIDFSLIKPRKCSEETKEHFYDLMIKTSERFYR